MGPLAPLSPLNSRSCWVCLSTCRWPDGRCPMRIPPRQPAPLRRTDMTLRTSSLSLLSVTSGSCWTHFFFFIAYTFVMCQKKTHERSLVIWTHLFIPLSSVGAISLPKAAERGKRPCMYRTGVEGHGAESGASDRDFKVWTLINVWIALPQQRELAESAAPCPLQNVLNPFPTSSINYLITSSNYGILLVFTLIM